MTAKHLIRGYSWVGLLNVLLLQWLFVRLQVSVDNVTDRNIVGWKFIGLIWPTTGWTNAYKYLWRFS